MITKYGAGCFLKFEKTDVPLRFVKWIAYKFDTGSSEIQLGKNFIPVTKETIHNILHIPIGGPEIEPDREAGRTSFSLISMSLLFLKFHTLVTS